MSLSLRKIRPALWSLGAPATPGRTSFLFFQNARQQQTYGSLRCLARLQPQSDELKGKAPYLVKCLFASLCVPHAGKCNRALLRLDVR
jgi:hypothetical protein